MADVTLKYKGATIGELSESGSKTLETAGKYCEADILLEYVKPESGMPFNPLDYVPSLQGAFQSSSAQYPSDNLEINSIYGTMFSNTFRDYRAVKTIKLSSVLGVTTLAYCFFGCYAEEVDLSGLTIGNSVNWNGTFLNAPVKTIKGISFENASNVARCFEGCSSLENLSFRPNSCAVSFSLSNSSLLSNDSLVSVANGLISGSYTITLHATPKSRLSSIMGTINNDTFIADENGSANLYDFIANTKGWTVA